MQYFGFIILTRSVFDKDSGSLTAFFPPNCKLRTGINYIGRFAKLYFNIIKSGMNSSKLVGVDIVLDAFKFRP